MSGTIGTPAAFERMCDMPSRTSEIPLFDYTLTLCPHETLLGDLVHLRAVGYHEDAGWTVFDDTLGTVLARRSDTILEIRRSEQPIGTRDAEEM